MIYVYNYYINKNILQCVKTVASFDVTSNSNVQGIRRSIQHLVERVTKQTKHGSLQWETIVHLTEAYPLHGIYVSACSSKALPVASSNKIDKSVFEMLTFSLSQVKLTKPALSQRLQILLH